MDISNQVKELLATQQSEWPTMAENYNALSNVKVKNFDFNGFAFKVQFNPARITSSAAKVDKESIQKRACFLCKENRPPQQRDIIFDNSFAILINPFPIFPEHFTIASLQHIPQQIAGNFTTMLLLAQAMQSFTIFYNGPRCGASAPDHFHFQAGNKGFMTIENEMQALVSLYGTKCECNSGLYYKIADGIRNFIYIQSGNQQDVENIFSDIYDKLVKKYQNSDEPDLNILCSYTEGQWAVCIFPRAKHRPWQYFAEGIQNILLSPASVDLGGVLITPLEKDFDKISASDIIDILNQICISKEDLLNL